jgi:iron(III) transport system substrate-binding protein
MRRLISLFLMTTLFCTCGGGGEGPRQVVVYTSHDQLLSEPILQLFEARTGIEVLPVYDTEATKTTGLVNRIIAEAGRPRCDVFWNNEIVQTLRLVERGLTQPHHSPSAETIPPEFRDPESHWTGFAARARVIVLNTDVVSESVEVLDYDDSFTPTTLSGRAGLALPLFGTTATHFALIHTERGPVGAEEWLRSLEPSGVQILDSNGQVCDAVARGALACGWTDTDDVAVAMAEGQPVAQVLPEEGAILIPNTVAMIAGAPHPDEARALIDFLLSPSVEKRLASGAGAQIPLNPDVPALANVLDIGEIRVREVDWAEVTANFDDAMTLVNRILVAGE